jgi:hypothetical protein
VSHLRGAVQCCHRNSVKHHRGSAVRKLAGVAGRDELAGALHRLKLGKTFHRRVRTVALVAAEEKERAAMIAVKIMTHRSANGAPVYRRIFR